MQLRKIHQTAGGLSAPRESHPHMVLMRPPPLPATASRRNIAYHARTVAGREYHCPYYLSSPYWEPPDICSRLLIAPCRAVCSANRGAVANVAYAFAQQ